MRLDDEAVKLGCVEVGRSDSTLTVVVDHEQASHDVEWYERYGMEALLVGYGFEEFGFRDSIPCCFFLL